MVRKDAWNAFNFFEFTKARFMAQDVIYPGEGSMCTWEKGEINNNTIIVGDFNTPLTPMESSLGKFKKIEIIPSIFSDHNGVD